MFHFTVYVMESVFENIIFDIFKVVGVNRDNIKCFYRNRAREYGLDSSGSKYSLLQGSFK
jgi:hypothetical protein